jgi:CBS domain-containing protein
MIVRSILKAKGVNIETVAPGTSVMDASKILHQRRIGAVLVMNGADIKGILSERDIVRGICEFGTAVLTRPASDLMTREVVTCGLDDTVHALMELMTHNRIRHLPVLDKGKLVGIISIGDVVKNRIAETEMEARALQEYIVTG